MKRLLLALLLSPAAMGATYNVALSGGGVLTVNGLPYVNPSVTNSASVVWGVDGTGLLYATATGTNSSIVYVEGAAVAGPNFGLSTEVDPAVTASTNITFSLVNGSITTNKIDATFYSLLIATSGAGLGTNIFVNNILRQPARLTNSATVTWATNLNGDIEATSIAAGTGDVVGPATSTANTLAIYHGTTGKLLTNAPAISATNVQTITAAVAAYEPLNANKYQATNATLTAAATSGSTGTGAFVRADSPTVTGTWAFDTFTASNLTATTISGNGAGITNLSGTEIRSGTVADARIDSALARTNAPTLHSPTLLTPSLGVATATSLATGTLLVVSDFVQNSASIASALGAAVVLDFKWPVSTFAATNNVVVLQSTNRPSAATNVVFSMLRITGDTVDRTISYPASWKRLGTNITTIPSNKVVLVSGMCIGTAESGVTFGVAKEE